MKPISFIIPSRNNLKYLKQAYESIRKNQSVEHDEITLATTSIADTIFLKVLQMGRNTNINITDINELYEIGFRTLAIESYEDQVNGNNQLEEISDIHSIVNSAISNAVPDLEPSTILKFLKL